MNDIVPSRRALLGGGAAAAVVAGTAACSGSSKPATGGKPSQPAATVADLQTQEEALTITAFNRIKAKPDQAYPANQLVDSLEMQNLRQKLLMFNDPTKLGWVYLMLPGVGVVTVLPVQGKISSTQSAMTTNTGVHKDRGSYNSTTVIEDAVVQLPGDDLSYGPNEGGDGGIFFFTPDGVYVCWNGPFLYVDAPLKVLNAQSMLGYSDGSKPTPSKTN